MKTVQRVDDDAHRDAARARRGQSRLDLYPHVVVQRHVDLQMDAPLALPDRLEQPQARLPVVHLDFDAVAGQKRSARRRLEAAGEGGRPGRGRLESQWRRRKILHSQGREADGGRRVLAFVNDRRDRKSRGPQSCGHAREPHRVHGHRHVERLALIQHGTGVDDACGEAGQVQPRADRFAALHRPQPHRERVGRLRTAQARDGGQSVGREVGVEEKKRARAGPNHLDLLLDGAQWIGRRTPFHTKHAE